MAHSWDQECFYNYIIFYSKIVFYCYFSEFFRKTIIVSMIEEKSKNPEEKVLLTIGDDDIKEENFEPAEPNEVKII